jgi:hypothetical protein
MVNDIRLNIGFRRNIKVQKLHKRLGADGVLSLITLWAYTAEQYPLGKLHNLDADDVELAAMWPGERGVFVQTLIEIGFIDSKKQGLELHDWEKHQAWVVGAPARSEKARKGGKAKAAKVCKSAPSMLQASVEHATSTAPILSYPFPTLPILTKETDTNLPSLPASADSSVQTIVRVVPTRSGKPWPLTKEKMQDWARVFTAIDVPAECAKAALWLDDHPTRRKKPTGMSAYFSRWLGNANEKALQSRPKPEKRQGWSSMTDAQKAELDKALAEDAKYQAQLKAKKDELRNTQSTQDEQELDLGSLIAGWSGPQQG